MVQNTKQTLTAGQSLAEVCKTLLSQFETKLSPISFQRLLEKHAVAADPITILSRLCIDLGIRLDAVEGTVDQLKDCSFPSIAVNHEEPSFVVLTAADEKQVTLIVDKAVQLEMTLAEFNEQWSGVLLLAHKTEQAGDKDFTSNSKKQLLRRLQWPLIGVLLALVIVSIFLTQGVASLAALPLLMLKSTGLLLAIQLSRLELDEKAEGLFSKMCNAGKKFSCTKVISSDAALLFGSISMADIGIVYFSGSLVATLLAVLTANVDSILSLLALLTAAALPYTLFSLFYQARVVKSWCVLCLLVQGLLWLEGIAMLFYFSPKFLLSFHLVGTGIFIFSFTIALLFWILLKPALLQLTKSLPFQNHYYQLARHPQVFQTVITQQTQMPHQIIEGELTYGTPTAPIQLTVILSTFCTHCAEAFDYLQELGDLFPEQISISLRIISPLESPLAKDLLQLSVDNNKEKAWKYLGDWYQLMLKENVDKYDAEARKRSYEKWRKQSGISATAGPQASELFDQQIHWIAQQEVRATPLFIVNHYPWPTDLYDWKDIRYYIEELEELPFPEME